MTALAQYIKMQLSRGFSLPYTCNDRKDGCRANRGLFKSGFFLCRSLSDLNNTSLSGPPASGIRALVSLQPRRESIVENEGHVNKKVLVSAAAVCFLTHVLTVQGE